MRGLAVPDWSYRTVMRPLFFLFPPETARDLSLLMAWTIGAAGAGRGSASAVIGFLLGHMRADPRLRGRACPRPDLPHGRRPRARPGPGRRRHAGPARGSVSILELGPVTVEADPCSGDDHPRPVEHEAITRPDPAPESGPWPRWYAGWPAMASPPAATPCRSWP